VDAEVLLVYAAREVGVATVEGRKDAVTHRPVARNRADR